MQTGLCIVLLLFLFYNIYDEFIDSFSSIEIKSNINNKTYKVVEEYENRDKASDLMASIDIFIKDVIYQMNDYYIVNASKVNDEKELQQGQLFVKSLIRNYDSDRIQENKPDDLRFTSYTLGKDKLYICLREKISGKNKFHDLDTLKFVVLHELGHVITPEYNHSNRFWYNFKFLLEFTEKRGIYRSKDYKKYNTHYCGINIEYNPMFDPLPQN